MFHPVFINGQKDTDIVNNTDHMILEQILNDSDTQEKVRCCGRL